MIAKLAPTQGVEPVRVTDEDEYFPPPRELRELIPALDAVAAFAFGGDPDARRERGRTVRRRPQPRRVRGARSARSLARAPFRSFECLVERPLQGLGELRGRSRRPRHGERRSSGAAAVPTAPRPRSPPDRTREPSSAAHDLLGARHPDRHDRHVGAQREVRRARLQRLDLRAVLARAFGEDREPVARLQHRHRVAHCLAIGAVAATGNPPSDRKIELSTGILKTSALPMYRIRSFVTSARSVISIIERCEGASTYPPERGSRSLPTMRVRYRTPEPLATVHQTMR